MDNSYNKHDLVKTEHLDNHKFDNGIDTNSLNCSGTISGDSLEIQTITFVDGRGNRNQFVEMTSDDLDSIFG